MKKEQATVLCIDDQYEVIELAKLILRSKAYQFVSALGGKEGLRVAKDIQPDVILLDLMMPDMHGWDVYQQLKALDETAHIPVIVLTAKAQSIDKVLGLHMAKVDDYITKPFGVAELSESIERVISRNKMRTTP